MERGSHEQAHDVAVVVVPIPAQLLHLSLLLCGRPGVSVHYATSPTHIRQAKSRLHPAWGSGCVSQIRFHELPIPAFPSPPPDLNSASTKFPTHFQPLFDVFEHLRTPLSTLLPPRRRRSPQRGILRLPLRLGDELGDGGLSLPPLDGIVTEEIEVFARRQLAEATSGAGTLINTCRPIEGEFIDDLLSREPEHCDRKLFTVKELANGLLRSGQRFVWVLRDADRADIFTEEDNGNPQRMKLPPELEQKVEGTGMVVRGWAPQLEILAHPSMGAFVSHCGWNSCMESLCMGVPMIAWPMHSDQPTNAALVTEHLKVGVTVREWTPHGDEVVGRADIEEAIKRVMGLRGRESHKSTSQGSGRSCSSGGRRGRSFACRVRRLRCAHYQMMRALLLS
ncbi:hypothetical protein B296_00040118 [Ensete ventricosum]|uniref:Glycosyltransferase N-terminal domain-containing protein n=1 Tax=Ensete ventricosum TaxID=4639 RepID=A0A426XD34_ENSVE|nr:hypothetical protein B296_00040118 [Ensete ventricosum]